MRSVIASEFKLAVEAGVIERQEIVQWADDLLLAEEYDERIAEICLSGTGTSKDLIALLQSISAPDDTFAGFRRMLGRMHAALEAEPTRLPEFARFLEQFCSRHDYRLPDDLKFAFGLEDDLILAEDGQYGKVSDILARLLDSLSHFRSANINQGSPTPI